MFLMAISNGNYFNIFVPDSWTITKTQNVRLQGVINDVLKLGGRSHSKWPTSLCSIDCCSFRLKYFVVAM